MRIKARYNGTCPACRDPINAGETVEWHYVELWVEKAEVTT